MVERVFSSHQIYENFKQKNKDFIQDILEPNLTFDRKKGRRFPDNVYKGIHIVNRISYCAN